MYLEIIKNSKLPISLLLKNSKLKFTPKNPEYKNWMRIFGLSDKKNRVSGSSVHYIVHGENKIKV